MVGFNIREADPCEKKHNTCPPPGLRRPVFGKKAETAQKIQEAQDAMLPLGLEGFNTVKSRQAQ
jgi:hypothetical protein